MDTLQLLLARKTQLQQQIAECDAHISALTFLAGGQQTLPGIVQAATGASPFTVAPLATADSGGASELTSRSPDSVLLAAAAGAGLSIEELRERLADKERLNHELKAKDVAARAREAREKAEDKAKFVVDGVERTLTPPPTAV